MRALKEEVREGLTGPGPKRLPSHLLYDDLGSALFEAITHLPEYGLTRADARILSRNARDIVRAAGAPGAVAELGSGSGRKTRWILEALADREEREIRYFPIDLSASALAQCRVELGDIPRVRIELIEADYLAGLERAVRGAGATERLLVLFLGSTIGNFEPREAEEFLRRVRGVLRSGDALLLGTDLMRSPSRLIPAYDDSLGVTAAFNRNILVRLNRELGAGVDVTRFEHEARWNEAESRVEMHLVARERAMVASNGIRVELEPGETIWTESSYKYAPGDAAAMGERAGFVAGGTWTDEEWPFAETLLQVP
ncbi:MAG TPA: L-histidine N(alpha)-methyltransferase [Candidatus Eisenbacteria bacterium]|nr:L-histidine N(alpha)-methyltransferase [Candidatus Eisenbacteria bacterium]